LDSLLIDTLVCRLSRQSLIGRLTSTRIVYCQVMPGTVIEGATTILNDSSDSHVDWLWFIVELQLVGVLDVVRIGVLVAWGEEIVEAGKDPLRGNRVGRVCQHSALAILSSTAWSTKAQSESRWSGSFPVQSPKNPPAGADCALWRERFPRSAPPAARSAWRCGAELKPLGVGEVLGEVLGVQGGYLKPRAGVLSLLASAAAQR